MRVWLGRKPATPEVMRRALALAGFGFLFALGCSDSPSAPETEPTDPAPHPTFHDGGVPDAATTPLGPATLVPAPFVGADPEPLNGMRTDVDRPIFAEEPPPERRVVPLSGGTLLVLKDDRTAVASDPDRDQVYVADTAGERPLVTVPLEPGDEPGRAVQDGVGRVHVVLRGSGRVLTLAPSTFAVLERRAVCSAPRGLAWDAVEDAVFVACAGGELVKVPAAGGPATSVAQLDRDLRDVVVDGNTLYVSRFRSAEVIELDRASRTVRRTLRPATELNLFRRQLAGREGPAVTRFVPEVAWRLLRRPGGGVVMLHQRAFTGPVPIGGPGSSGAGYASGNCDDLVQATVSDLGVSDPSPFPAGFLTGTPLAIDFAVSPDGEDVTIVSPAGASTPERGSDVIVVPRSDFVLGAESFGCVTPFERLKREPVDPSRNDGGASHEPLATTWAMGETSISARRLRHHVFNADVVAVAYAGDDVVVQTRQPAALLVPRLGRQILLSEAKRTDAGHAIFHANAGAGLACASCHPEGGDDGHVWSFVKLGARRTQSLRGGISATAPLHWDGQITDMPHIAREVFTGRMGGPQLSTNQTSALAGWVDQVPLLPATAAADAKQVSRGRQLFFDAEVGCATCHSGPHYTNNLTVEVGTGGSFQVPSLLGVAYRAPFMHNGCSMTLEGRFDVSCGGDRHGSTATLSAADRSALAAFLSTL